MAVIYVYTPVDATGKMLITINNNEYSSDISNGVAVFNISGLGNGTHIITANYNGDDKYLKSTNKSSITVNKLESSISVSAGDIDVGDSEVITVVVPGDATGTVTITVDGKDYTSSISGGNAVFYINNLAEGSYTVVARYNGDNKYNANDNSTSFVVSKNVIDPVGDNKTSVDVVENENGTSTITVNVPEDATGNVTITVGDKNYTVPIVNGTASVTVDKVDNNTNISVSNAAQVFTDKDSCKTDILRFTLVSKLVNCGKVLYNLSSNFTNKSLFLHIKLKCPISLFPILTKLTPITLSSCLIEDKSK